LSFSGYLLEAAIRRVWAGGGLGLIAWRSRGSWELEPAEPDRGGPPHRNRRRRGSLAKRQGIAVAAAAFLLFLFGRCPGSGGDSPAAGVLR